MKTTIIQGRTPRTDGIMDSSVPLIFPVGRDADDVGVFRTLDEEELFLNTLITGGKGKRKTASLIKPFLR